MSPRTRGAGAGKAKGRSRWGYERRVPTRALERTRKDAERRYGRWRNVVGVGIGTKLVNGAPTDTHDSVQFFVRRKTGSRARTRSPLPTFVWMRDGKGKSRRRRKLVTDVIEVGRVELACRAGTRIGTTGRSGVATLVFQNKLPGDRRFYLITCAHVVGRLGNPRVDEEVTGECCGDGGEQVMARTVAMTGIEAGRVRYDVAIARLTDGCMPQPDGEVDGAAGLVMRRLAKGSAVHAGTTIRMALRGGLNITGGVLSSATVEVGGVPMENLRMTNIAVRFGDSGSLVYRDDAAIGILVARSEADGTGWFQPLDEALAHVGRKGDVRIRCFED